MVFTNMSNKKRTCFHCGEHIPPETEHFYKDGEHYCAECVEVETYTAHVYYINGEYLGGSESDYVEHIEDREDEHEE